jgi:hypothetical protein
VPDSIERADAVSDAFDGNPTTVATPDGDVAITSIVSDNDGTVGWVDVLVDSPINDDRNFRVVNPPMYVEDPQGDVVLGDGRRYREDPLAALAHTIAMHGGSRGKRR